MVNEPGVILAIKTRKFELGYKERSVIHHVELNVTIKNRKKAKFESKMYPGWET